MSDVLNCPACSQNGLSQMSATIVKRRTELQFFCNRCAEQPCLIMDSNDRSLGTRLHWEIRWRDQQDDIRRVLGDVDDTFKPAGTWVKPFA